MTTSRTLVRYTLAGAPAPLAAPFAPRAALGDEVLSVKADPA